MSTRRTIFVGSNRGLSLIELIVFILIVSVALVALLRVLNVTTQHGSDPMITKQMQAIAEEYIEEVTAMPYTWCDPLDANVATATSSALGIGAAGCATTKEGPGPETIGGTLETRGGTPSFNNVDDFNNYSSDPALDASGNHKFNDYKVAVTVVNDGSANLGPAGKQVVSTDTLHVTVTVTQKANPSNTLVLEAYRTRYAPNNFQ